MCLHYTVHSIQYTVGIKTRAQSTKSSKREKTGEKIYLRFKILFIYFEVKYFMETHLLFRHCQTRWSNKQTNYELYMHYTVQCTQISMYHICNSSVTQKQARGEELYEKLILDLEADCFWALPWVIQLLYIIHINSRILFKHSWYICTQLNINVLSLIYS